MTEHTLQPQERVEAVFSGLRDIHELVALGARTVPGEQWNQIDELINRNFVEVGAALLPEAAADIRADPDSWWRIQYGTSFFREHVKFLLARNPVHATDQMREIVAAALEALLRQPPDRETKLITQHPFIGTIVAHLSKAALEKDARFERPYGGWFSDVLDHVEHAQSALDRYMTRCIRRAHDPLMRAFLTDLKADLEDFLLACVHMGCSLAMHAQTENCAVFMPLTSYHVTREDVPSIEEEMENILALPVYQEHEKAVRAAGVHGNHVAVPTFMSVFDLKECTALLSMYVEKLAAGRMRIDVRPERSEESDARIKFVPIDRHFGDFNMRIDYDKYGDIALDIGGARCVDAMKYARALGEDSRDHAMVMRYSRIVDDDGAIVRMEDPRDLLQRGERYRYTSVMLSSLSAGARMALVAAGIITGGKELIFPQRDVFTYHLRGRLNKPEYRAHFAAIAREARGVFQ